MTEPANGRISLRDYIDQRFESVEEALEKSEDAAAARDTRLHEDMRDGDKALREHIAEQVMQIERAITQQERAVDKAFDAASSLSEAHNGLLRKMEKQQENYITKEMWEADKERAEDRSSLTIGQVIAAVVAIAAVAAILVGAFT